ncbi:MAG TPA: MFS transporter [Nocardioides sp.]|uniref:MFS transporter n=1 Tax=Nocardioides sp. TaxID=35761 RepID=UPI002E32A767|nr:MFS transporter [Nocardioides sp.]HEX3929109.1 MFS transporter [Nocardioides sp.]
MATSRAGGRSRADGAATPYARPRLAAASGFFTQGFVFISLTTRLPKVQDRWHYSDTTLSLLLLMMVLLAGVGSVLAETACRRVDSATILRCGLLGIAVAVPVFAVAPDRAVFMASMAVYGVSLGAVDATTNMQAVALEHRYERPILPSFHGSWTLGGFLGSAVALAMGHLPISATGVVAVLPLAVAFAPFLRRTGKRVVVHPEVHVPWRPIVLVGLAMVLFYMVDTAAFTWGPQYLDKVFPTPSGLVALAVFPYLLASGAVRLCGDALVARLGAVPVLRVGTVVACAGLAVTVFAPVWPVAVLGFLIVGGGVAVVAPLSFSAAARIAGEDETDPVLRHLRVDAVIGRFNQFNYVGSLLGAVMTGLVGAGDLRLGFAVPMVLVLGILPLARAFAPNR